MSKKGLILILTLSFLSTWLPAQKEDKEPKKEERQQTPDFRGEQQNRPRSIERPIFLQGTVILDDGSRVPEPVHVQLVCHGDVRRQVYTAPDGSFNFQISSDPFSQFGQAPMDASIATPSGGFGADPFGRAGGRGRLGGVNAPGGGSTFSRLSGCEIRAELPGFQSEIITLGPRQPLDNPEVGTIVLHRIGDDVQGSIVSVKSLSAPKKAKNAYQDAAEELEKEKPDYEKAIEKLNEAVEVHPEFAVAWQLLGQVHIRRENVATARQAFEQAIQADPQYISPYLSLANIELQEKRWNEAAKLSRRVLELNPYAVRAHYFNGVAQYFLGQLGPAEESIRFIQGSSEAGSYPVTHYLLGSILAMRRDFQEAALEYEQFLQVQKQGEMAERLRDKLAEWKEKGLIEEAVVREP